MSPRIAFALMALCIGPLASGCASEQSLAQSARAACQEEGVQPGPAMDECVQQTEETIRRAREYRPEPPPRPASNQHHN